MMDPLKLVTVQGFDQEFTRLIARDDYTHIQAFEELNEVVENATGNPRYADYNSYRNARRRRLKAE